MQGQFFALVGDGDQGETVTLAEGHVVRRLPTLDRRPYQSVFGLFELDRVVYGTREGQQIQFVPLDARLGLPAGKFSYLLQDWDQALVVENPYQQVNHVLSRILGVEQSVASLEQTTHTLATAVDAFRATQPPAPVAAAPQIIVLSGDGKGVPLRKPATAPPIQAHDHQRGPKPDRKKMALVGAVYQLFEPLRTRCCCQNWKIYIGSIKRAFFRTTMGYQKSLSAKNSSFTMKRPVSLESEHSPDRNPVGKTGGIRLDFSSCSPSATPGG